MTKAEKEAKEYFKDKTDKELKELFLSCWDSIFNAECYSCRDLRLMDMAGFELGRRGYTIQEQSIPKINKVEID